MFQRSKIIVSKNGGIAYNFVMRALIIFMVLWTGLLSAQTRQKGAGGFGQRMDANGDGKISPEEFPGPKIFFDQFDADKNGFLSAAEREAMRRARMQQGGRRPGQGGGGAGQQELFRALDLDTDQKLSAKEWGVLLQAADFKKADSQADGHVTSEEWMRFFGQGQRPARGGDGGGGGAQVGALAPKVSAQFMAGDRVLDLSKIKRHTVVVFGSYT